MGLLKIMKIVQKLLLLSLFFISSSIAQELNKEQIVEVHPKTENSLNYLLYLPKDYDAKKKYPLLLFLHGIGERGNDNLKKLFHTGLPSNLKNGLELPFIVVMPQCPDDGPMGKGESFWWHKKVMAKVKNILDGEIQQRAVDTKRIYVTGLSMGGFGTYRIINMYPQFFAAAAPICGHDAGQGKPEKLKTLPMWAFHGEKDKVVPLAGQQSTVDNYKKAGVDIKFTIYPSVGHDSWNQAYANPKFYEWLSQQKKE